MRAANSSSHLNRNLKSQVQGLQRLPATLDLGLETFDLSMFHLTFLGTGTSVGVPMIGCDCATCHSTDPRDKRTRCSIWVRTEEVSLIVDTGPDLRAQCLREGIRELDAVLYTHGHMDHLVGFDDLRRFSVPLDKRLDIYGQNPVLMSLVSMFPYAFVPRQLESFGYVKPALHEVKGPFSLGDLVITPFTVEHGNVPTCGFLFAQDGQKRLAYASDCKRLPPASLDLIRGVDTLAIDALRYRDHATHMTIPEALECRALVAPRQTWFTHMTCDVRHAEVEATLPPGVGLAHDGLGVELGDGGICDIGIACRPQSTCGHTNSAQARITSSNR